MRNSPSTRVGIISFITGDSCAGAVRRPPKAVMMTAGAAMPIERPVKTLIFDRPFALLIGESQTGALLFAGVIQEP